MMAAILGALLWVLLVATAWKHTTIRPALHRYDRIGAMVFFIAVGLPAFIAGLALIARAAIA